VERATKFLSSKEIGVRNTESRELRCVEKRETISDDKNTSMISTSLSLAESADAGLQAQSSGSSGSSVDPLDRRVDVKSDSVDPGISRARDDAHEVQKHVDDCDSDSNQTSTCLIDLNTATLQI